MREADRQTGTDRNRQTETGRQKQRQQDEQIDREKGTQASQREIKNTDSHTQQQQNLKRSAFLLL